MSSRPALIEVRGLTKSFVGNVVLSKVDLAVEGGEVHAIVGENGAGKSTLIKTLGGLYQPDAGEFYVDGVACRLKSPRDALARGIVVIHQELSLAPDLTVEENIFLGRFTRTAWGTIDRKTMRARTLALFGQLAVTVDPSRRAGDLSIATQQMVEIAKAISADVKVLILDEPTAVLDEDRIETLFAVMERLRVKGIGIIYISHHLHEIFRVANRVTVLRDGQRTGHALVADVDHDWVVRRMIGRDFLQHTPQVRNAGRPALEVIGLSCAPFVQDVSFSVGEGEVVGLAGLVGAGRSEIAQAIMGVNRLTAGRLRVFGQEVEIRNPRSAARLRIAYVTEDRKTQGLLHNRPVRENATISNLQRFNLLGFLRLGMELDYVLGMVRRLDIRLANVKTEIRTLSGGNQQKVLIARALAVEPRILIFDEPTRGVDIGAKQEIYNFIETLIAGGAAILLISSEMEEILRLSDRVVVLRQGRVAARLSREDATETSIMRAAALA
jgi:ABC-type sugar transport system ATPase subunit